MTGHSEHFETWAEKAGYATQRTFSGYVSPLTQCAWMAWQAGVGVMQEEIAALRAEKLTDASALRLALERIAALEKVAEAAPELERVKYAWALYCGRGSKWDDAWREAGYLKEEG